MSVQDLAAVWQAVFAGASLVATLVLAWVVSRASDRMARIEYARAVREGWVSVDTVALQDDKTLMTMDRLFFPNVQRPGVDEARKVWLAYLALNSHSSLYSGITHGLYPKEYDLRVLAGMLLPLLRDDTIFALTQNSGYEPGFAAFCRRTRTDAGLPVS